MVLLVGWPQAGWAQAEPQETAFQAFYERCPVTPDSPQGQQLPVQWDLLLGMGYTPQRLEELAAGIPDDCGYVSFKSAVLAVDHGVAETDLAPVPTTGAVSDESTAVAAEAPPAPRLSPWQRKLHRWTTGHGKQWALPSALGIGAGVLGIIIGASMSQDPGMCHALLPGYCMDGSGAALLIPMSSYGIYYAALGAAAVHDTLIRAHTIIDTSPSASAASETFRSTGTVQLVGGLVGVSTCAMLVGMGIRFEVSGLSWLGAGCMTLPMAFVHAAITNLRLARQASAQANTGASRRRSGGLRLTVVSPFLIAGEW